MEHCFCFFFLDIISIKYYCFDRVRQMGLYYHKCSCKVVVFMHMQLIMPLKKQYNYRIEWWFYILFVMFINEVML